MENTLFYSVGLAFAFLGIGRLYLLIAKDEKRLVELEKAVSHLK